MEGLDTNHYLNELWTLHSSRGDRMSLFQYLEEFVGVYSELIQPKFHEKINPSSTCCYKIKDTVVELEHLPEQLLQLILNQLMRLQDQSSDLNIPDVRLATYLVQTMIIISRTGDPELFSLSSNLIGHVVLIASQVVTMLRSEGRTKRDLNSLEEFLSQFFFFTECLYDPLFNWRKTIARKKIEKRETVKVPLLNMEVIPFFYETLQIHSHVLNTTLQWRLLSMFGSILFGLHGNALLATSSTTLEILLKYITEYSGGTDNYKQTINGHNSDNDTNNETNNAINNETNNAINNETNNAINNDTNNAFNNGSDNDYENVDLILRLIVKMVHTLHNSNPGQCQLDVSTVMKEYFKLLSKTNSNPEVQLKIIGFIPDFLATKDRAALQMLLLNHGCLDHLKNVLTNFAAKSEERSLENEKFASHFINIVNCLVAGSMTAKDQFSKSLGTQFILDNLRVICTPTQQVLLALLSMAVESDKPLSFPIPIKNVFIVLMLFEWLPDIKQVEQQVWLSSVLTTLFTTCTSNKILACHCKTVTKVLTILIKYPDLHKDTTLNLLNLIQRLGSYTLTPRQTAGYLELLRQDSASHPHMNKYFAHIMKGLSLMAAHQVTDRKPAYFFDLQDQTSGITAPVLKKWGGPAFSIHAWLCLEFFMAEARVRKRRQFYSFMTDQGTGMEAFFTSDCMLVVAVITKKNYFTIKLNEHPIHDNKWHCIQIVHHPARKVFGFNGSLQIFVDNELKLTTSLRFPSLSSSFTSCHIGSSAHRTNASYLPPDRSANENNSANSDRVVVIETGSQDEVWGQATSLLGQLGSVVVFNDVIKAAHLTAMFNIGPDMWRSNRSAESPLEEVPASKVVLYYEAKACFRHVCKDVSCNEPPREGRLTGHKIYTTDVKDSINCLGGITVLSPLIEAINSKYQLQMEALRNNNGSNEDMSDEFRDSNLMADFFTLIMNFITSSNTGLGWHAVNAEMMVSCGTVATLGALIKKMPTSLLDEHLLRSIQCLVKAVNFTQCNNGALLMDLYQYLLFDFRIWCLTDANVQYSHVQYLSTIIKENKKFFRLTFGVQYLLDVIKTYYCSANEEISSEKMRNIRNSLLGLVRYYITDDITIGEMTSLFNFMLACKDLKDVFICEILEILKGLLHSNCKEQFCSHMGSTYACDVIYAMLAIQSFSDAIRVAICQFLLILFKSRSVAEKHKSNLKSTGVGLHGILWQMNEFGLSHQLSALILDLVMAAECDSATFIAVLGLLRRSDLSIRKLACQHFLELAYSKHNFLLECANQKAWQVTLTNLLALDVDGYSSNPQSPVGNTDLTSSVLNGNSIGTELNGLDSTLDSLSFSSDSKSQVSSNSSSDYLIVKHKDVKIEGDFVDLVVECIFLIAWRGVQGSNKEAWKERTLVFDCLSNVAEQHTLLAGYDVIKAGILEHCLEASMSDVRESATTSVRSGVAEATENSAELIRFIDQQLNRDDATVDLWSEKLLGNLFALYDSLVVWDSGLGRGDEWSELSNLGFRTLLGCVRTSKLELVAMASAKLHNLVHSREPASTHEVCYLLDGLQLAVAASIEEKSDVKEFVVPLIRDLLDKNFTRLDLGPHLSVLPPMTGNPRFFDDFIAYSQSTEWAEFINSVKQNASHFRKDSFEATPPSGGEDNFLVAFHLSGREKGEVQLKFKSHFETNFFEQRQSEEERQSKNSKSLYNQNVAVLRQWRAAKRFLASERGFWKERNPGKTYWKLSNVENFSRMRLKLTENHSFDLHEDASRLRDNLEPSEIEARKSTEDALQFAAVLTPNEASKEDDGVGDEDWNMLASNLSTPEEQSSKEKVVFSEDCELVTLMDVVGGRLEVSTTHVYFYDKSSETEEGQESGLDFKWSLSQLREVHLRRYNLRKCAIEVFLVDQTNYFLNFHEPHTMHVAYKTLFNVRPPNLLYYGIRSPQELLKSSGLTAKWVQREVSNFDYLMQLNTIAGRTYNDLSQYPVFPWILSDYTSEKLDLSNPQVYRDLSKPIGILNPANEQQVRDKHDQFEDPSGVVAKFHYGSHYSNAASVLFFMLRMEPFTTLHIQLQAGRFDLSDRQFHSMAATFQNMLDSTNDVKELIPEFFYMPEFLSNSNKFNLGKLQFSKETVDNVVLPPWAKSPEDFIFQHRKALESDYVSSHLHEWIDLIFGHKQRGQAAVDACNVFYYCTYEGAVDLNSISDPIQRKAVEGMINNFGQTPTQLLPDPHPRRMGVEEASRKVVGGGRIMSTLNIDVKSPNVLEQPDQLKTFYVDIMEPNDPLIYVTVPRSQSHSFMQSGMPDAMVTVSERCVIGSHGWLPYDRSITNYFTFEKDPAVNHSRLQKRIKGLLSPGLRLNANLFLASHDAKFLFVGGFWDNSIRVMTLRGRMVANLVRHLDVATCLALDHGGVYLLSGSYDTTCIIWKITVSGSDSVAGQPVHILYGHEDVVTSVVVNSELDVALSSSKDGTCIIHTVRKGHYVRTIRPVGNHILEYTIPLVCMSGEGRIVVYARARQEQGVEKHFLHLFSINGKHLALDCLEARLAHMAVCGEHLVTGDQSGLLAIRELSSFDEISSLSLCRPITCVYVTKGMTHIMACLRDGKLIIVGVDRPVKPRGLFKT